MKQALLLTIFALVLCLGVPMLLFRGAQEPVPTDQPLPETRETTRESQPPLQDQVQLVRVLQGQQVVTMTMEQYLTGVLLGEMPSDFAAEALKAQAVVCRTYTLRRCKTPKHSSADICTDSGCCQAYRDPAQYTGAQLETVQAAIAATDGQVLRYEGELIDATFFSSSGGRTESAVAVWGSDIPYLQAVDSPGEQSPHNQDVVTVEPEEFRKKILQEKPSANLSGTPRSWLGSVTQTPGDGVESMTIGGVEISGTKLRQLFGLRSTAFALTWTGEYFQFTTRGFGHRVGMSQYGAQAMALAGKTWQEILLYYYQGVTIGW